MGGGATDHYPLHSDIALGVELPELWWTRGALGVVDPIHDALSNMTFTTGASTFTTPSSHNHDHDERPSHRWVLSSADSGAELSFCHFTTTGGVCDGVTISGNHFTSTKSAVLLGAARGVKVVGNTAYWDSEPSPTNQMALLTAGGNCSRFFARDISFSSNSRVYYYLKRSTGARMAGFSKWVEILDPQVGSGVQTSPPYAGQSCNYFHTYESDAVKRQNFAARFPGNPLFLCIMHVLIWNDWFIAALRRAGQTN